MTSTRQSLRRTEPRRAVVVVVVAAALAALVVTSTRSSPANPQPTEQSVATIALSAESSAFYCGGLEHVAGLVESDVAIADLASTKRIVEVTTTNEKNQVSLRQVVVAPGHVVHLSPANIVGGSLEAVSIVASGGGIAATEAIRGVNGAAVAPCLTRAGTSWWLTGGSTKKGQSLVLSVFNPYASTAVFSVTLQTPAGVSPPLAYKQIVLGPHRLAALSVRAVAPGESPITTHVVATVGSVVVYGIGRSTTGASSISLLPGTPDPATASYFPVGSSATRRTTQLLVSNPSTVPVSAAVHVWAPPGCTLHCPRPFVINIGALGYTLLTLSPSSRVPRGRGMAAELVASGAGVVAVQRVQDDGAVGQNAPLHDPGTSASNHLVLVNPLASGFDDVGLVNRTSSTVHVTLGTVGRHGPVVIGSTIAIAPHSTVQLGPSSLRGMVEGVLVLFADGQLSAAGDVHGALRGSSVLVAAPTL